MRVTSSVMLLFAASVLAVIAFLHFPVPYVQLKPLPPRERLGSIRDIGPDTPERPPLNAKQEHQISRVFGAMCRNSVRSESERRRLKFRNDRVIRLCDCSVETMIEAAHDNWEKKGFEDFGLIAGRDRAGDRQVLEDARYLAIVTGLERACAAR